MMATGIVGCRSAAVLLVMPLQVLQWPLWVGLAATAARARQVQSAVAAAAVVEGAGQYCLAGASQHDRKRTASSPLLGRQQASNPWC